MINSRDRKSIVGDWILVIVCCILISSMSFSIGQLWYKRHNTSVINTQVDSDTISDLEHFQIKEFYDYKDNVKVTVTIKRGLK